MRTKYKCNITPFFQIFSHKALFLTQKTCFLFFQNTNTKNKPRATFPRYFLSMHSYINSDGFTVFTEQFFRERGHCCGNNCLHCPYGKLTENTKNEAIKAVDTAQLPDFRVAIAAGKLSSQLRKMNINSFHQAARFVCLMPYGRNRVVGNALNLLAEQRGTCSGKHHFLAALAHENGVQNLHLTLGIYKMTAQNTPKIGAVLAKNDLDYIPEAHTYLKYEGLIFDFTSLSANTNHRFKTDLLLEKTVDFQELAEQKIPFHKQFLANWLRETKLEARFSLDELWQIRENCIATLTD